MVVVSELLDLVVSDNHILDGSLEHQLRRQLWVWIVGHLQNLGLEVLDGLALEDLVTHLIYQGHTKEEHHILASQQEDVHEREGQLFGQVVSEERLEPAYHAVVEDHPPGHWQARL